MFSLRGRRRPRPEAARLAAQAGALATRLDDLARRGKTRPDQVVALAVGLTTLAAGSRTIDQTLSQATRRIEEANQAVGRVGEGVSAVVDRLNTVAEAADEITRIALQTRLVAFSASVEARRAGEAGRSLGVVAEAVTDLAARVERSSRLIMNTLVQLDGRVGQLSREITGGQDGSRSECQLALNGIEVALQEIGRTARMGLATAVDSQRTLDALAADLSDSDGCLDETREALRLLIAAAQI